jgi:hypothetical protein
MTDKDHEKETCLERARLVSLDTLNSLCERDLSGKEADAVEAAIEDELIALRVTTFCSGRVARHAVLPMSLDMAKRARRKSR